MSDPLDYFADVPKTEMMRVIVALATEAYETRDRLAALEAALLANGVNLDVLDSPVEPAAFDKEKLKQRDEFVRRVFSGMSE